MEYLELLARFLLALIFTLSGFYKILQRDNYRAVMTQAFPIPLFFLAGAIFLLLSGGLGLLLGWNTRLSAGTIIFFLVVASSVFHVPLLRDAEPLRVRYGQDEILKNLAMIGGLLKFILDGSSHYALDNVAAAAPWRVAFYGGLALLSCLAFTAKPLPEPEPAVEGEAATAEDEAQPEGPAPAEEGTEETGATEPAPTEGENAASDAASQGEAPQGQP